VVAVGKRNATWAGSGGANAQVWFIDAYGGQIVESVDLGSGVNARQVSVTNDGAVVVAHTFKV
jgi:hypothetical protein